jgi:hypothetical protein
MREIKLKLWQNDSGDWSVEINGRRHEHVTTATIESLVECALIVAETSLAKA